MRRIALVANPRSRGGAKREGIVEALRSAEAEVEVFGLGEEDRAAGAGADRIAVAGGDGTVAPVAAAAGRAGVPLAVIPAGTANDFARGLGLPLNLAAACRLAAVGERTRAHELGYLDGRPFVNAASLGLAVAAAERAGRLKRSLGAPAYFVGALRAGFLERPVECRIACDGRSVFVGKAWQVIVAASGRFGAGSHMGVAEPSDGLLDAAVVPAGPRVRLVAYAWTMRTGRVDEHPRVSHARGDEVEVEAPARTRWNVDGELVEHGAGRLWAMPAAFEVVVP